MALSIQQQIASIKNQLARLEDQIKEETGEKTFTITFECRTNSEFWGGQEPTVELIHKSIVSSWDDIFLAMPIDGELYLKEVEEV